MYAQILVAETDPAMAALLAKGLRRHNLAPDLVTAADTAPAAMSGNYAVVLLDLDDDQHGTLAVLRELRAVGCTTPVVVLAGRHGPHDRAAALAAGADEFAPAPLRFATLVPLIQALITRRN